MTAIGVARDDGVVLRSCAACGRHAWTSHGEELTRTELLKVLRETSPPAARPGPRPAARPAVRPGKAAPARPRIVASAAPLDQKSELQELLRGFTVHGRTS